MVEIARDPRCDACAGPAGPETRAAP